MNATRLELPVVPGAPQSHRGIVLVPLFPARAPRAAYVTLEDALARGLAIGEVSEAGSVGELAAVNPTDDDVLLHDGEQLVGAKQDRILDVTVLVAARSTATLPVSCVERGRWARRTPTFDAARQAANPALRRTKLERLVASPAPCGAAQAAVWAEVDAQARRLGVASPTAAHGDTFAAQAPAIEALREAFALPPGSVGALLAAGPITCLDYVSRPDAWTLLGPKLLDGYLLDALEHLDATPAVAPAALLDALGRATAQTRPGVAKGEQVRLTGAGAVGSGLALDGELLQLSGFARRRPPGPGTLAPPPRYRD